MMNSEELCAQVMLHAVSHISETASGVKYLNKCLSAVFKQLDLITFYREIRFGPLRLSDSYREL